ncbi:MAG: hypothetical protein LBH28_07760 [Oscillospiraceae bacterium]|nr:hypothetical protein [Oscillospiraceae bacterium]
MKRKRLSALLGCILALTVLAGFVVPIAGRAADFELTVLNPKADFEQINNMPLADRKPLQDKLNSKQPLNILVLFYGKFSNEQETWGVAWALKDYWMGKYGYTDAGIKLTGVFDNAGTGTNNTTRYWKALGVPPPLGTPWGTKSGKSYIDGMPVKEEPFERYQAWSEYDAVVFGVAD